MENMSNISSEQELLHLRNEGKISEAEYAELLETLRKSAKVDVGPAGPAQWYRVQDTPSRPPATPEVGAAV